MDQVTVNILSDIHLEDSTNSTKTISSLIPDFPAEVLILAGDIGHPSNPSYKQILSVMSNIYSKVFVIAGNHEYFSALSMEDINALIEEIVMEFPNCSFLNCKSEVYRGVKFMGCTLWGPSDQDAPNHISDYNNIPNFSVGLCSSLHKSHIKWLTEELSSYQGAKVVITHHLPTIKLINKKRNTSKYSASDQKSLILQTDYWICGHWHQANCLVMGNCQLQMNPVGREKDQTGFDKNLTLII